MQHGVPLAEAGSPIPWLTMPELVAKAIDKDNRRTVGLIGTKMVTTGSTYQTHLGLKGITVLAPENDEIELLDSVIYSELIYGRITTASRDAVLRVVENLASRGCEAVVLASSEAPLVITPEVCGLPIYDAAAILARGAVGLASGL